MSPTEPFLTVGLPLGASGRSPRVSKGSIDVDFLIAQGADLNIKDTKVGATPAGWAAHAGQVELKNYLDEARKTRQGDL